VESSRSHEECVRVRVRAARGEDGLLSARASKARDFGKSSWGGGNYMVTGDSLDGLKNFKT